MRKVKPNNVPLTLDLRDRLKVLVESELDRLPGLLDGLNDKERLDVILKLIPLVMPKAKPCIITLMNLQTGGRLFDTDSLLYRTFLTYLGFNFVFLIFLMPKIPTFPDCFDQVKQVSITSLTNTWAFFGPVGLFADRTAGHAAESRPVR